MAKTTMNKYSKGDVNEVKPIKGTLKGNKGWVNWSDALAGSFYNFLMTKKQTFLGN